MARRLKFMAEPELNPSLVQCPYCEGRERLGIHSQKERLYRCHACRKTFSEKKGTVFENLHYPSWVVVLVLKLLAYGCPVQAIVQALWLDERTVAEWQAKAGKKGRQVQEQIVCNGQVELGQTQADELCVNTQGGKAWMATAMVVFARLWLWHPEGSRVSPRRDRHLILRLMRKVAQAAASTTQPVLIAVDGFAAYPKAILRSFYTKVYTGLAGRPRHLTWPNLNIVQVVKSYQGRKFAQVQTRLAFGRWQQVYALIGLSQLEPGKINTAYIAPRGFPLNATFRSRMPALVRRTRQLACSCQRLELEMFWSGTVYNFCTVHSSLGATPAMAAGLTDHLWSIDELLRFGGPRFSTPRSSLE